MDKKGLCWERSGRQTGKGKDSSSGPHAHPHDHTGPTGGLTCTSVGMLGTEPVKPFSAMVPCELLGELGPEPGALLHTDDTTGDGGCHLGLL